MIQRIFSWLSGAVVGLALLLPAAGIAQTGAKTYSNEQLEQLTAPVALYPDALLAQLFMATTYPDQFAAAANWSKAHPNDKGDDAVKKVENEPWDPSVASLVAFPEVLITFGDKPDWVRDMGDAFLAQPNDVMNAVQRLRQKAQQAGNLKTNAEVKVSTQAVTPAPTTVVQQSAPPPQVIVVEPAQPNVVYVPAYNPTVVYGPWPYPAYPPYYYPPPPGYWFSRAVVGGIAWGIGIGISNALWGGCNWSHGNVNINVNRYNNINVNRQINAVGNNANWNHNPANRGATPYRGGDATRQNLDRKYQSGAREQYRGRDAAATPATRDASRERAAQAMQDRGVAANTGSAMDRAQSIERNGAQQGRQDMNRGGQNFGQGAGGRDNALAGAGDRQARQQMDRGMASHQASSRPAPSAGFSGGGAGGGGARMSGGGGGARMGGGGGGGRGGRR